MELGCDHGTVAKAARRGMQRGEGPGTASDGLADGESGGGQVGISDGRVGHLAGSENEGGPVRAVLGGAVSSREDKAEGDSPDGRRRRGAGKIGGARGT